VVTRILRRLKATQDAEEIADYIAKDSLEAAVKFLENSETTLRDVAATPSSGSPFDSEHPQLANLRFRRALGFTNHLIFYFEHKSAIEVVRILHGARDLDTELRKT